MLGGNRSATVYKQTQTTSHRPPGRRPLVFPVTLSCCRQSKETCLESFSLVVFIHLPVLGTSLLSLSGECSVFLIFPEAHGGRQGMVL